MDKISDVELLQEFESGKTMKEIADKYDYKDPTWLSKRLSKLKNYKGRKSVSLTENSGSFVVRIPKEYIKEAGFDPEKNLRVRRLSRDGEIVLKLMLNKGDKK